MLYNKHNLAVAKIASKSDIRPAISGVFFTDKKTVATDSFRLIEMSVPKDSKAENFPKDNKKSAMRGCKPFILNASYLQKNVKVKEDSIAISHIDDNKVEILQVVDGMVMPKYIPRITSEQFPDYEKIFPTAKPVAEVSVNATYLAEICELLGKLNNLNSVKIKFYGEGQPVLIEGEGVNQSGRGLVMPLRK